MAIITELIYLKNEYIDMDRYKVKSSKDNQVFFVTDCYKRLCEIFETLKTGKGKIIHVVGAPGTGKSANIFHALQKTDLNIYNAKFSLKFDGESSKEVFNKLFKDLSNDLGVKTKKDGYKRLSEYDCVLIADSFHDSHNLNDNKIGFSQWTDKAGFKAFYFYLLCIKEYFKNKKYFEKINLVFQTAWKIRIRGKKYDIFTDFSFLSKILVKLLNMFFIVVEISYSEKETIDIVRMHINDADAEMIKLHIKKYGHKPRFICNALEK